jgi:mycothiol synthase
MSIHIEAPRTEADAQAWARILDRVEGIRVDVDELRHTFETDRESLWALAYLDGEVAGFGLGRPSSLPRSVYGAVRVLPEYRRRGVGAVLLDAIRGHAVGRGADDVWGRIRADDTGSLAFADRHGFREVGRECDVVLHLAKVPPHEPDVPPGITLVSFAERADLIPAVFALDNEVSVDVPAHREHEPVPYERWAQENVEGPGASPEACFIALAGDEVVGYTALRRYGADSAEAGNQLTAVRREWRRRGIATALKRAQIEAARVAGIERIFTSNDETNVGMRGVNARLGFEPEPERIVVGGPA